MGGPWSEEAKANAARIARDKRIARAYTKGERMADIAERFGLSFISVRRIVAAQGAQKPARLLPGRHSLRNRQIAAAYRLGATQHELATQHGLTQSRIWHILKQENALPTAEERYARQAIGRESGRIGRKRLALPDDQIAFYVKIRRYYGAAYARKEMGLSA